MDRDDYDDMEAKEMMYGEIHELREPARDLSKRLEKAHEEAEGYKNGQAQLQKICDGLMDSIEKYAAERKRLLEENQLLRRKIENHIIMSEDFKAEYNSWLDSINENAP